MHRFRLIPGGSVSGRCEMQVGLDRSFATYITFRRRHSRYDATSGDVIREMCRDGDSLRTKLETRLLFKSLSFFQSK